MLAASRAKALLPLLCMPPDEYNPSPEKKLYTCSLFQSTPYPYLSGILMPPEEEASVAAAIGQARMYVENSRSLGGMPTRIQAKLYENERRRIEEVLDRVLTEGEMLKMVVKSDNEDLGTVETANREHFLAVCQRINKKETKVRFNVRQMKELTDFVEQYQKAVEKGAKLGELDAFVSLCTDLGCVWIMERFAA